MLDRSIEEILLDKQRMEKSIQNAIANFLQWYPGVNLAIEIEITNHSLNDGKNNHSINVDAKIEL